MTEVEIWSDFACPFCYIGKQHFENALNSFADHHNVHIVYRSFELDPNAEKNQVESIDKVLARKYSQSLEWAEKANERVSKMAADCGLKFNMKKIIPTNSFNAHRLSQLAKTKGQQRKLQDLMFEAYFSKGVDIAKEDELLKLGEQAGLLRNDILDVLKTNKFAQEVRKDEEDAHEFGISGVPFFLFNQKYGISGAQPSDVFLRALMKVQNESKSNSLI